ncbi:TerD family protein [Thalassospira xiamenensis]|uniref:Tellurium resistance protein TerD n=1 Tax=Thalassospira xiamenensis TaxID=220697 RepID=A0A285TSE9_9PROT|nr:TerD family protein [Thalassospira xiamenensis]SOC26551.1 tellurium resistance protein TerD [Thalassospira xiamenensis]
MAVKLNKGEGISLRKEAPNLNEVTIGLGWDEPSQNGVQVQADLDASVFLLSGSGKCRTEDDFVFYGNLTNKSRTVVHHGDNRTGAGDGDDEKIDIKLTQIDPAIERLPIVVSIHDQHGTDLTFGQVRNAFIRLVDKNTDTEIARFDLTSDGLHETAMIFGELYRRDGDWRFKAVGQGINGGLAALVVSYGLTVEN